MMKHGRMRWLLGAVALGLLGCQRSITVVDGRYHGGPAVRGTPLKPPPAKKKRRARGSRIRSGGPRFGALVFTGEAASSLEGVLYDREQPPYPGAIQAMSAIGWQLEYEYETSKGGPVGLVELIPLVGGLDYGKALPSLTVLMGLRLAGGLEFGLGPCFAPAKDEDTGDAKLGLNFVGHVGYTFRRSGMNLPLNLVLIKDEKPGIRIGVLMGWNMRR